MPTTTSSSGLTERSSLRVAGIGVNSSGLRLDSGSANSLSCLGNAAIISGVRCRIQTGLPRHSTVIFSPGFRPEMSASTGAPAAFARSDGSKLDTNGTAVARPPTAPAQPVASNQVRLLWSTGVSLTLIFGESCRYVAGMQSRRAL